MTTYQRAIRTGRWLASRRKLLPVAAVVATVIALLLATPFHILHHRIWLTCLALVLAVAGLALRCAAQGPARRKGETELGEIIEAKGIYSVIRFPLYTSNLLLIFSFTAYAGIGWYALGVVMACLVATYSIILAREHTLQSRYGEQFTNWCRTTWALTPSLLNWEPSTLPRRPMRTLAAQMPLVAMMCVGFSIVDLVKNLLVDFRFTVATAWLVATAATILISIICKSRR